MKGSERVYRLMLRLYPLAFRQEYGDEMAQAFRDMQRAAAGRGVVGMVRLWLYLLAETVSRALIEHRDAIRSTAGRGIDYTPSKTDLLVLFVPIVGIMIALYAINESQNTTYIYLLILIAGVGGWLLSRFGLIRANPLWNTYTLGILFGISFLILFMFSSVPALAIYRLGLPPLSILVVSLAIYAAGISVSGRLVGSHVRRYRITAFMLAVIVTAAMLITSRRPADALTFFYSLNYSYMQTLGMLVMSSISIGLIRIIGQRALILLMITLGVQFIFIDPGYFTGDAGRWINLSALVFPLVICPAWLLIARTRRAQLWGTFALWTILIGVVTVVPSAARVAMGLTYETPDIWVHQILMRLPLIAVVWLAIRAASTSEGDSDATVMTVLRDNPAS